MHERSKFWLTDDAVVSACWYRAVSLNEQKSSFLPFYPPVNTLKRRLSAANMAALRRNLSRPVLIRRLEKGDRCVVPSHKQQAE